MLWDGGPHVMGRWSHVMGRAQGFGFRAWTADPCYGAYYGTERACLEVRDLTHDPRFDWCGWLSCLQVLRREIIGVGVCFFGAIRMVDVKDVSTARLDPRVDFVVVQHDGTAWRVHPHGKGIKDAQPQPGNMLHWVPGDDLPAAWLALSVPSLVAGIGGQQAEDLAWGGSGHPVDIGMLRRIPHLMRISSGDARLALESGAELTHWWRWLANLAPPLQEQVCAGGGVMAMQRVESDQPDRKSNGECLPKHTLSCTG